MASKKNKARSARDLNPRKFKKKTSVLVIEKVEYIDYKDVDLLGRFMSDRAKIKNRRVAGNTLQQQREIANAVKVAREMALLPYAKPRLRTDRVATSILALPHTGAPATRLSSGTRGGSERA